MSHLRLGDRRVAVSPLVGGSPEPPTHWAALRAAHAEVGQRPLRSILVCLLYQARTYFQSKH